MIEKELLRILDDEKIEYFGVLPFDSLIVKKQYLIDRLTFKPRSALIFLAPYYSGEGVNISRYAVARDYHIFLDSVGKKLGDALYDAVGARSAAFGDHSPIDERAAAKLAGLGSIGENGLLINEKYGTYVFIGELLCDMDLSEYLPKCTYVVPECSGCGKCKAACPKERIGVCLSALTQKKGELSSSEQEVIREYGSAWGCDLCQSVCPHNDEPTLTPIPFFLRNRIPCLDRKTVLNMTDEEFAVRAYSWRSRETVLRNLDTLEQGRVEKTL